MNKKNQNTFKTLFTILDSDEDENISNATINTKWFDENFYKILEPIFKELKEENEILKWKWICYYIWKII